MKTSEYLDPEDGSPPRGLGSEMEGKRGTKRRWEGEEGAVFKGDDPSE
jgi:hypothetical protein